MNIIKNNNFFQIDNTELTFTIVEGTPEILCETQCHIPTKYGKMFFDISMTIEGQFFDNIEDWVNELYRQIS